MNAAPAMVKPAYKITLTAQQTLEVGRLTVIWGQIDHFLFLTTTGLIAVDLAAGVTVMQDMTTGQLLNLFRKNKARIADPKIRKAATKFCDEMGGLIEKRNHIMHGLWGMYMPGKSPKKGKPACLFVKDFLNPLFPEDVTKLANRAAEKSIEIHEIYCAIHGLEVPTEQPTFWFGQHDPKPPKGMTIVPVGPLAEGRPR